MGLRRLALGRSFDRACACVIGILSAFTIYILAANITDNLSLAIIFSTLEMMATLRIKLTVFTQGIALYYELEVIFSRFSSIFNIKPKSMTRISSRTL